MSGCCLLADMNRAVSFLIGAQALAEQLGTDLVEFPGGHGGYRTDHQAFAKKLCELLDRERR
jgi:hypothetical protein